jgi:hypothetical protein
VVFHKTCNFLFKLNILNFFAQFYIVINLLLIAVILMPLSPGKNKFALKINNSIQFNSLLFTRMC